MTTKTLEEVKELAKGYDLVPIRGRNFCRFGYADSVVKKNCGRKKELLSVREC